MFILSERPLAPEELANWLADVRAGAIVTFEGRVRNHHQGKEVKVLEYEAYEPLAVKEGRRILEEAHESFDILIARCVHRVGRLEVGEPAIWIGVSAGHRQPAFQACQFVIDELKRRVPIWKKEHYADGSSIWVNCAQEAQTVARQVTAVTNSQ